MIVRDAAGTLQTALESVRPWVDELVICDTGSTDDTPTIARRYTNLVFHTPWHDHFAQARQAAHDLCHGRWVMFLDADDELFNGQVVRKAVEDAPHDLDALLMEYVTDRDGQGRPAMSFWRERVTRAGLFHWTGRVHEVLEPNGQARYRRLDGAWVDHRGHGDGTASLNRNVTLLRMAHDEDPGNPRTLFYLGRDLLMLGKYEEGLGILEAYLKVATWLDEAHAALLLIGDALRRQSRFQDAYKSDVRMLNVQPLWPQTYFALAEDCYYLKAWRECLHFSQIGEALPLPSTNLFLNEQAIRTSWMIYRVVALHQLGRVQEAYDLTERAAALLPDDQVHQSNLRFYRAALDHAQVDLQEALAAGSA